MERKITHIDTLRLATGLQKILLDMSKDGKEPAFPIFRFEEMIQERHLVSAKEAERVTEKILGTGIIRWNLSNNCFVL